MAVSLGTATVMGAGAWGTAIAKVAADAGNDVRLWARTAQVADEINRTGETPATWTTSNCHRTSTPPMTPPRHWPA